MSVVCAAIKNDKIAIACDTQTSFGNTAVSAKHMANSNKLYTVNKSVIGIVGWSAMADMLGHLIREKPHLFKFDNRRQIYKTLLNLHKRMKNKYFLEVHEDHGQPVESSQLDAIIINKNGLFEIGSYREVNQYRTFWAIGSGRRYALGAMHALYKDETSAKSIVKAGIRAAAEFDDGCSLPLRVRVFKIKSFK